MVAAVLAAMLVGGCQKSETAQVVPAPPAATAPAAQPIPPPADSPQAEAAAEQHAVDASAPAADASPAEIAAYKGTTGAAPDPAAAPTPAPDREWYVLATKSGGCLPMGIALGVKSPDEFISEAAKKGGNYRYVKNDDEMAMVAEPLSGQPPIAFMRGKNTCILAMKMLQAGGQ